MKNRLVDGIEVQRSSGNVLADLGLRDADKLKIKSELVIEIRKAMCRLGITQQEAAMRMGITQPKVSDLMRVISPICPNANQWMPEPTWLRHRNQGEAGGQGGWPIEAGHRVRFCMPAYQAQNGQGPRLADHAAEVLHVRNIGYTNRKERER